jgi:hypothetical protein
VKALSVSLTDELAMVAGAMGSRGCAIRGSPFLSSNFTRPQSKSGGILH